MCGLCDSFPEVATRDNSDKTIERGDQSEREGDKISREQWPSRAPKYRECHLFGWLVGWTLILSVTISDWFCLR